MRLGHNDTATQWDWCTQRWPLYGKVFLSSPPPPPPHTHTLTSWLNQAEVSGAMNIEYIIAPNNGMGEASSVISDTSVDNSRERKRETAQYNNAKRLWTIDERESGKQLSKTMLNSMSQGLT